MCMYHGYLFTKLDNIGSKSEGPKYFLQRFDYKEKVVIKQAHLWMEDEKLHPFVSKKVSIDGRLTPEGILYISIADYSGEDIELENNKLDIEVRIGSDPLSINKMPDSGSPTQAMDISLMIRWPYRSYWVGQCPSTQTYDMSIEKEGKTLWKWSDNKVFSQVLTPVSIPGSSKFTEFQELWKISPEMIESEGTYTVRALYIATGQEVIKDFEVKFAK